VGSRAQLTAVPDTKRRLFRGSSIVGFVLTCVLGLLVYLSTLQLQPPETPVATPTEHVDSTADFPARVEQVTAALAQLPLPLPQPTAVPQGAGKLRWVHRIYELTVPELKDAGAIDRVFEPLRHVTRGVTVQATRDANGAKVQVGVDGLLTHTLVLRWLGHKPRAAIIVDNLGSDLLGARTLADIQAPLTFAVRASQPFSKEVAELASLLGREVLMQLPPAPERLTIAETPRAETPRTETPRAETPRTETPRTQRGGLLRWFGENLAGVPHAVGVTTEPGAGLSGNAEGMQWILDATKEHNLFLVEVAGASAANTCDAAAAAGVGCVHSDVLLDDTSEEEAVRKQLDNVLQTTHTRGDTVAVGHATPALAAALRAVVPEFAAAGVELVPASTVVEDRSLSRH
jgi:polysaccharide deacetylase 2 family uncharacterized protein YibQ